MHLTTMLDLLESGQGDRVLLRDGARTVTGGDLASLARAAAVRSRGASAIVYVGENHPFLPVLFFAAVLLDVPYVPLNYRLPDDGLHRLVDQLPGSAVVADDVSQHRLAAAGAVSMEDWLPDAGYAGLEGEPGGPVDLAGESVAVTLFTSGTTAAPKQARLRHRHLMSYLLGSVDFAAASPGEATLIAVPPYHVAGVTNMLSNLFAGRRLVYLRQFDARAWVSTVRAESVTSAMVVPTMLARIVEELEQKPVALPTLGSLAYGGAKVSERLVRRALQALPSTGMVNAYGLTETTSTVTVLTPDDHRLALDSTDPLVRARLGSVGRALPGVEIEIRDESNRAVGPGEVGLIHVRGEQVAGEYATGSSLDDDGWFCTRDHGWTDTDGYLYVVGRADDTIIRGGENIAPAEIEAAFLALDDVVDACVVGIADEEWGQDIAAVVVLRPGAQVGADELRDLVRPTLRGAKTPRHVLIRDRLPHTDTGKLLRRVVQQDVEALLVATSTEGS